MQSQNNFKLPQRKIANESVPAIGMGLMGMSIAYTLKTEVSNEEKEKEHLELLTRAADAGETFWDTADAYGPYTNEELVGKWFKMTGRRKEIFLATKFSLSFDPATFQMSIRGDKEYVRQACEASLKRLGTDYIDLYYQHRVDPKTTIEETVGAMAELVKEGKVKYLGLSECSANTLRRAHKVHPISAYQVEYSLFTLDIEREEIGLKKTCEELGVAIIAYSPLGRGLLGGQIKSRSDFHPDDKKLIFPRFSEENFPNNLKLVEEVEKLAKKKGCAPSQLALAWLLQQGDSVIPIPGTRQVKYMEENLGALKIQFTPEELKQIRDVAEKAEVKGERYPQMFISSLFAESI